MIKILSNIIAILLVSQLLAPAVKAQSTAQQIETGRENSQASRVKPYLIMISLDGFRSDYAGLYQADNLIRLAKYGISAERMLPSYPSKTFPNHYTLITGLYPSHHGIVDNRFYDAARKQIYSLGDKVAVRDGSWYGGVPLWVLAEQQHLLSASYYWVGSEAAILHTRPTYYYNYADTVSIGRRIQQVINWLKLPAASRPHLITFYMPEVDHAGHSFGPESVQVRQAVHFADSAIGIMVRRTDSLHLALNYMIVSDHGMAKVLRDSPIRINLDTAGIHPLKIAGGETQLNLYFSDSLSTSVAFNLLNRADPRFHVYYKKDVPAAFHYSTADDKFNRIGDLVLISVYPDVFGGSGQKGPLGTHGFDPALPEMGAIFYAWGPAFKSGMVIPAFENINIYPLAASILRLQISNPVDGKLSVLKKVLK